MLHTNVTKEKERGDETKKNQRNRYPNSKNISAHKL